MGRTPAFDTPGRTGCVGALSTILLTMIAGIAHGEDSVASSAQPTSGAEWTFNLDATYGFFGFGNSLYTSPKPGEPSGDLGARWSEGSIKPAIGGYYTLSNASQVYAALSAVGEGTFGAAASRIGRDMTSVGVEDAYIGWRSGNSLPNLGENALDFTIGRAQYKLGHGLILYDGAAEGGSRGGYWTNARKAFEFAAIGRFKPGQNTLEAFYLKKDELPEARSKTALWGVNYEYAFGEDTTLGATYLKFSADPALAPQRDGLRVYNLRAYTAPFPNLKALSFEAECVKEDNGDKLNSEAWNALVAWQFESGWKPKLSYRYAFFQGDNPATQRNEGFDGLLAGFYDWGSWWQGEIAGEYFVSNSNLISHQLRLHAKPSDSIGTGFIVYDFKLDKPRALGPQVTSDDVGQEIDGYLDWSINRHFILSFVAAAAEPGQAIKQLSGRTGNFIYGMIFGAYSF